MAQTGVASPTSERHAWCDVAKSSDVVRAVRELENPALAAQVHAALRHLIVDEYQDINPAQERLIELLTGPRVELCVVGDDQQAIYQWRGSGVRNIVKFSMRHDNVTTFEITTNRRSQFGERGVGTRYEAMDFNKLKDKAQQVYQERGGATAAKGDGQELKDILQGEGSLMDKAKRAGEALKTPGAAQDPASNAPSARTSPPSEQPEASVAPPEKPPASPDERPREGS